jgi:hypothetical protein
MQLETGTPYLGSLCRPSILKRLGRNRVLIGGGALTLLAAGLGWQWSRLVAIGVAPSLVGAAPCLAMCALGLCMHRMGKRPAGSSQDGPTARLASESPSIQQES